MNEMDLLRHKLKEVTAALKEACDVAFAAEEERVALLPTTRSHRIDELRLVGGVLENDQSQSLGDIDRALLGKVFHDLEMRKLQTTICLATEAFIRKYTAGKNSMTEQECRVEIRAMRDAVEAWRLAQ